MQIEITSLQHWRQVYEDLELEASRSSYFNADRQRMVVRKPAGLRY